MAHFELFGHNHPHIVGESIYISYPRVVDFLKLGKVIALVVHAEM